MNTEIDENAEIPHALFTGPWRAEEYSIVIFISLFGIISVICLIVITVKLCRQNKGVAIVDKPHDYVDIDAPGFDVFSTVETYLSKNNTTGASNTYNPTPKGYHPGGSKMKGSSNPGPDLPDKNLPFASLQRPQLENQRPNVKQFSSLPRTQMEYRSQKVKYTPNTPTLEEIPLQPLSHCEDKEDTLPKPPQVLYENTMKQPPQSVPRPRPQKPHIYGNTTPNQLYENQQIIRQGAKQQTREHMYGNVDYYPPPPNNI